MNEIHAEKDVAVDGETAWVALTHFNEWVEEIELVDRIEYDKTPIFCYVGRNYKLHMPEGFPIKYRISMLDRKNLEIHIEGHASIFKNELICKIIPLGDRKCRLIRQQIYEGLPGSLFKSFFSKREKSEGQQYVEAWARYARKLDKERYDKDSHSK
ncbi:hypothetical protein D3H64_05195 [Atopobacter sp. AH10]|uniref:hypothetical protein n=1 Tax=Atopobacter sp. AH10 TaxID=2315861 RepID=UPI000EF1CA1F|nr:hypothetical protein [Atopobacter sp. AH10]RLK63378.1 hypothetical protein D3H64_05195 [Atopobacter sp. AH10]